MQIDGTYDRLVSIGKGLHHHLHNASNPSELLLCIQRLQLFEQHCILWQ